MTERGEVVEMVGRRVRVRLEDGEERVVKVRAKVVVGDRVTLEGGEIASFEERETELLRGGGKTRVICANATLLLAVSAATDPPFRPGLVDRLLVAASAAGMDAALVLNKCDRGMESAVLEKIARYEALGYPSFLVSATLSKGFEPLLDALRVETAVLVGHSGVGKTSMLKVLVPGVERPIGSLDAWGRGRHTTTSASLFTLPTGGRIIDVPGIREFGIDHLERGELRQHFPELDGLACRYRDCLHLGEEGCVATEVCEEDRLESYQKLMEELI